MRNAAVVGFYGGKFVRRALVYLGESYVERLRVFIILRVRIASGDALYGAGERLLRLGYDVLGGQYVLARIRMRDC